MQTSYTDNPDSPCNDSPLDTDEYDDADHPIEGMGTPKEIKNDSGKEVKPESEVEILNGTPRVFDELSTGKQDRRASRRRRASSWLVMRRSNPADFKSPGLLLGILMTANLLAFIAGFGLGWWGKSRVPTLTVYELHLNPTHIF